MTSFTIRPFSTRYVILFVERAGSTYLTSLLDSHPDIVSLREEMAVIKDKAGTADQQIDWLQRFFSPPWVSRTKAWGFKTKLLDIMDPDRFADVLEGKKCRVLLLRRRNTIKAVVSTINAKRLWEKSGTWNLLQEADRMPAFSIDPDLFQSLVQERERWDQEIEDYAGKLSVPKISLVYEDLLVNEGNFLARIYNFLDVPAKPVQGKTYKHTKDDLREVILNFDALKSLYRGTPYEAMFDEVLA